MGKYKPGDIVYHRMTNEPLMILHCEDHGEAQGGRSSTSYIVRLPNYQTQRDIREWELKDAK